MDTFLAIPNKFKKTLSDTRIERCFLNQHVIQQGYNQPFLLVNNNTHAKYGMHKVAGVSKTGTDAEIPPFYTLIWRYL